MTKITVTNPASNILKLMVSVVDADTSAVVDKQYVSPGGFATVQVPDNHYTLTNVFK